MIKINFTFLFFLIFGFSVLSQNFEGKITMSILDDKTNALQAINYYTNGTESAFSIAQEGMSVTLLMKDSTMYMILHPMKAYMAVPLDDANMKKDTAKADDVKIVNTGETSVINGLNCTKYLITDTNGENAIAWFTKDIGSFFLFNFDNGGEGAGGIFGSLKELSKQFPVLISTKTGDKETKVLEVTKVERMKVPPSMLLIPAGYKVMDENMFK
jgi:hypothetical protein